MGSGYIKTVWCFLLNQKVCLCNLSYNFTLFLAIVSKLGSALAPSSRRCVQGTDTALHLISSEKQLVSSSPFIAAHSGPTSFLLCLSSCVRVDCFFYKSKVRYFQASLCLGPLLSVVLPASPYNPLLPAAMQAGVSISDSPSPPSVLILEHLFTQPSTFTRAEKLGKRRGCLVLVYVLRHLIEAEREKVACITSPQSPHTAKQREMPATSRKESGLSPFKFLYQVFHYDT